VNDKVVLVECCIVVRVIRIHGEEHERARLLLLSDDTRLRYFPRQQRQCTRNTILHVYRSNIGVNPLLEKNLDRSTAIVTGRRGDVTHALDTVDLFLERDDHTLQYGLSICTWVERTHPYGWRCYVGILRDGQVDQ